MRPHMQCSTTPERLTTPIITLSLSARPPRPRPSYRITSHPILRCPLAASTPPARDLPRALGATTTARPRRCTEALTTWSAGRRTSMSSPPACRLPYLQPHPPEKAMGQVHRAPTGTAPRIQPLSNRERYCQIWLSEVFPSSHHRGACRRALR